MNKIIRVSIEKLFKLLAILTLKRFKPDIIGVTGSAGKTSTKEAIYTVLRTEWRVRPSPGNFNGEIGMPLAILGDWTEHELTVLSHEAQGVTTKDKVLFILKVIGLSLARLLFLPRSRYPEILVLEYAADKPGDIKYLLEIAVPRISVVTAVGDIPVHVEFYEDAAAVAREKGRLVQALPATGGAVLNADEARVTAMAEKTRANVLTFGFSPDAQVRVSNFEVKTEEQGKSKYGRPTGVTFKLEYQNTFVPVRISGAIGKPQAYSAAAAAAVGLGYELNLVQIAEALSYYRPPHQRMNVVTGEKKCTIIDDSYNSSPLAARSALETLADIPARRKVAILGDMKELGKHSKTAHEALGRQAAEVCDLLITVGVEAKAVFHAAQGAGLSAKKVLWFENTTQLLSELGDLIKEGDLVLIKASHSVGLGAAVQALRSASAVHQSFFKKMKPLM